MTPAEDAILKALAGRAATASICPSEAARIVAPDQWRDHMDEIRRAGVRLAVAGRIDVCQKGEPVDPETARGPIRYRLR